MSRSGNGKPFAKRSFGQNFLVDPNYIRKIVDAVAPSPNDVVVEIGPGRGAITRRLLDRAEKVIAIELDRDMAAVLDEEFGTNPRFKLIEGDILEVDLSSIVGDKPVKLVGNLPYNVSTNILQRLIKDRGSFSSSVLMFQREVVDRISARPGDSDRGFLTVLAEMYFDVERLFDVPPTAFRPMPKVWSSVARLTPKPPIVADHSGFRQLVSCAFAQKRKTLQNNLRHQFDNAAQILAKAGIDPSRRAEALTIEEWVRLAAAADVTVL